MLNLRNILQHDLDLNAYVTYAVSITVKTKSLQTNPKNFHTSMLTFYCVMRYYYHYFQYYYYHYYYYYYYYYNLTRI